MTRRFSITLPDDVAAVLDNVDNASAYIAEALRLRRHRDATRELLAAAGYHPTDEGVQRMRERLAANRAARAKRQAAGQ
jgi:hypothetical protein